MNYHWVFCFKTLYSIIHQQHKPQMSQEVVSPRKINPDWTFIIFLHEKQKFTELNISNFQHVLSSRCFVEVGLFTSNFFFVVLRVESTALCMWTRYFTSALSPQPEHWLLCQKKPWFTFGGIWSLTRKHEEHLRKVTTQTRIRPPNQKQQNLPSWSERLHSTWKRIHEYSQVFWVRQQRASIAGHVFNLVQYIKDSAFPETYDYKPAPKDLFCWLNLNYLIITEQKSVNFLHKRSESKHFRLFDKTISLANAQLFIEIQKQ